MTPIELKIKLTTLAAEGRIIRKNEVRILKRLRKARERNKTPSPVSEAERISLYHHRINVVRPEARAAQLAYGFLRGRRYEELEKKCYEAPNAKRVTDIVKRFGKTDAWSGVEEWLKGGPAYGADA